MGKISTHSSAAVVFLSPLKEYYALIEKIKVTCEDGPETGVYRAYVMPATPGGRFRNNQSNRIINYKFGLIVSAITRT